MMKKIILIAVIAFTLAGCQTEKNTNQTLNNNSSESMPLNQSNKGSETVNENSSNLSTTKNPLIEKDIKDLNSNSKLIKMASEFAEHLDKNKNDGSDKEKIDYLNNELKVKYPSVAVTLPLVSSPAVAYFKEKNIEICTVITFEIQENDKINTKTIVVKQEDKKICDDLVKEFKKPIKK